MQPAIWAYPRACSVCCKSNGWRHDHRRSPGTGRAPPGDRRKRRCKSGVSSNRTRTVSSTVPGVIIRQPGCHRPVPPRRHRPAGRTPARRAGRPPCAAPPEHRHRGGDRAAHRRRRPGRAPGRCAFPAAAPGPACSRRRLRAAVLITAHARAGEARHPRFTTPRETPPGPARPQAHPAQDTRRRLQRCHQPPVDAAAIGIGRPHRESAHAADASHVARCR